eukprot:COSAG05_NODE_2306_length_3249_cov_2.568889_3_plen_57_part_00
MIRLCVLVTAYWCAVLDLHVFISAMRQEDTIVGMLELAKCHIRQDQPNAALDVYEL